MLIRSLYSEQEQIDYGSQLAQSWFKSQIKNFLIYCYGNLGAGKTTFIRGFLRGLNFNDHVKSPSYTLVESYEINKQLILHVDLYRLHDANELINLGLLDEIKNCGVCLIEWPEQGGDLLPPADLACYIDITEQGREIKLEAVSGRGETVLIALSNS